MTSDRLGVVVIGCGDIAVSQHLPALVRDKRFEVIAVVDAIRERAERAAALFGVALVVDDVAAGLALEPRVVVIATPPHVSPHVAGEALTGGAHVLCEKPMAVSLDAADRLVEQAQESGRVFQVGFKDRFSPLVQGLRHLVMEGRLGAPLLFRIAAFDEAYRPSDRLHTDRINGFLEAGAPVIHDGAHTADVLSWMLGPPTSVSAVSFRSDPSFPAPNYHCATITYGDGSVAKVEVGWWFPHMLPGEFHVYGPGGAAEMSRSGGYLRFHDGLETIEQRCDEDWQAICFREQLDAFHRAIDGEPQYGADARAGRDALALTVAIVEAAEFRHSVRYEVRV